MLSSPRLPDFAIVAATDKAFYVQLGERITAARKAQGLTQTQVAEALGIAQQAASCESRSRSWRRWHRHSGSASRTWWACPPGARVSGDPRQDCNSRSSA